MIVTAKDLRFKISMLFDVLSKGEEVFITYRGKTKAKLTPINEDSHKDKDDEIFGMWADKDLNINQKVREMRKGRVFDNL